MLAVNLGIQIGILSRSPLRFTFWPTTINHSKPLLSLDVMAGLKSLQAAIRTKYGHSIYWHVGRKSG